jgi:hypothetical protein
MYAENTTQPDLTNGMDAMQNEGAAGSAVEVLELSDGQIIWLVLFSMFDKVDINMFIGLWWTDFAPLVKISMETSRHLSLT